MDLSVLVELLPRCCDQVGEAGSEVGSDEAVDEADLEAQCLEKDTGIISRPRRRLAERRGTTSTILGLPRLVMDMMEAMSLARAVSKSVGKLGGPRIIPMKEAIVAESLGQS